MVFFFGNKKNEPAALKQSASEENKNTGFKVCILSPLMSNNCLRRMIKISRVSMVFTTSNLVSKFYNSMMFPQQNAPPQQKIKIVYFEDNDFTLEKELLNVKFANILQTPMTPTNENNVMNNQNINIEKQEELNENINQNKANLGDSDKELDQQGEDYNSDDSLDAIDDKPKPLTVEIKKKNDQPTIPFILDKNKFKFVNNFALIDSKTFFNLLDADNSTSNEEDIVPDSNEIAFIFFSGLQMFFRFLFVKNNL